MDLCQDEPALAAGISADTDRKNPEDALYLGVEGKRLNFMELSASPILNKHMSVAKLLPHRIILTP